MSSPSTSQQAPREVSWLLSMGIFFLPGLCVWFLLRKGYSSRARVVGFLWAGFVALIWIAVSNISFPEREELSEGDPEAFAEQKEEIAPEETMEPEVPEAEQPVEETQLADISEPLTEEQRKGFHCLNSWDGSHWGMQDAIKSRLRNPDSFEHVETGISPIDEAGNHAIFMTFRAENGFGGMNVQQAIGVVDNADCELLVLQML